MRAKFGIKNAGNTGDIGKVLWTVGRVSARHGEVSDSAGMKCSKSVELPKLDVTGSIPVAHSKIFSPNRISHRFVICERFTC
jgi:hypothetical protein